MDYKLIAIKCPCCKELITINLDSGEIPTVFFDANTAVRFLPCIDLANERGDMCD